MDVREQIQHPNLRLDPTNLTGESRNDGTVSEHCFVRHLEFEKRRADRSRSPLSIALFHTHASSANQLQDYERLVKMVRDSKRITDILGQFGNGTVAILLLDTGPEGTEAFVNKVKSKAEGIWFSTVTGTYPDHIFENIKAGYEASPVFDAVWLSKYPKSRGFERLLKRVFDLVAATVGLVVLSPVMICTAIAIAATSPGRVIFKQVRLGKRGAPFVLYKFRSMVCDADESIHREYVTELIRRSDEVDGARNSRVWTKLSSDPRVTSVGRIIRKTGLDELPQLFNVVRGDLSLVGPRPALPYEAEQYEAWQLRRLFSVKPGITGLWQVEGANGCTFEEMVRMDLRYVRRWSLLLDLKLVWKTIWILLHRRGVH